MRSSAAHPGSGTNWTTPWNGTPTGSAVRSAVAHEAKVALYWLIEATAFYRAISLMVFHSPA